MLTEAQNRMALKAELVVPGCPPSPNVRMHHMVRARQVKFWRQVTWKLAQSARNRSNWPLPSREDSMRYVRIRLHRPRLLDPDNAVASIKPVLDGLIGSLVWDDAERWLVLLPVEQVPASRETTEVRVWREDPRC